MINESNLDRTKPAPQWGPKQREFACPVCRAKQVAQTECRRCGADLSLYVKALYSVEESRRQLELANRSGDTQLASHVSNYMQWLIPKEFDYAASIPQSTANPLRLRAPFLSSRENGFGD